MTLRRRVLAYLVVLHAILLALAFAAFRQEPPLLVLAEISIAVSIVVGWWLVRQFFIPLEIVATGAELLEESDFTTRFVETGQSDIDGLVRVYNAMAASLLDERRNVQEQSSLTRRIVASMPTAVVICDFDGRVESVNPAAAELAGSRQLEGESLAEIADAPFDALARLLPGGSTIVMAGPRRFRCARIEFDDRSFGRSWYLAEELTRELRDSERSAYATLIRTISHEVNNSVGAIASMLDGAAGQDGMAERTATVLRISSERLRHLSRFVNDYAELVRIPPPDLRPIDLNGLVEDVVILHGSMGTALTVDLARDLPQVRLDRNQIEQALINILKNAREAMDATEGLIRVRTRVENDTVLLEVHDSGPGVADSDRVFTPFFSTKDEGRGLGLTIVSQILDNHGFDYTLTNAETGGALFRISMPRN